jgi:hypothetical protein
MNGHAIARELRNLEQSIKNRNLDFSALYVALTDLRQWIEKFPAAVCVETVSVLKDVLEDSRHTSQKQAYFLFKEAADTLACIAVAQRIDRPVVEAAIGSLRSIVSRTKGHAHRAAAEAVGSFPLGIRGPELPLEHSENAPPIHWEELLDRNALSIASDPFMMGRSLVAPIEQHEALLVVKLACSKDSPAAIGQEAAWMEHLCSCSSAFSVRFDVPAPLKIDGSLLFRLKSLPAIRCIRSDLHPEGYAIAFTAHPDYFNYINEPNKNLQPDHSPFKETMLRNAWLLGKLASWGIVHSAPIPLFHNRVQRERRADGGLYEWPRGGRLDRWLHSCRYPNFGLTGIRDLEHLISFQGMSRKLYQYIGTHILSLLLVVGSYFRNQDSSRVGFDCRGKPVDARELFHQPSVRELIEGILKFYYRGFVGRELADAIPANLDRLTRRMIDEMGVDRHMEEILRAVDQREMTDDAFREFLLERGFSQTQVSTLRKGTEDIVIHTGPHLGGFNDRISLPELIEFVATASALCIAGRYAAEAV